MSDPRLRFCETCGVEFVAKRSRFKNGGRSCSQSCEARHPDRLRRINERAAALLPLLFWLRVNKSGPTLREELGPCWIWTGKKVRGYGTLSVHSKGKLAHRVAWWLTYGEWPNGCACHRCDNPSCVNPGHIFIGTHEDNMRDMFSKGRRRHAHGESFSVSKLTEAQVVSILADVVAGKNIAFLAKQHCVKYACIEAILSGRSWRHIPRPAGFSEWVASRTFRHSYDLGRKVRAGDPAAVALVVAALERHAGKVEPVSDDLGVSAGTIHAWERVVPEVRAAAVRAQEGRPGRGRPRRSKAA
jgi:hypothetical protein